MYGGSRARSRYKLPYRLGRVTGSAGELPTTGDQHEPLSDSGGSWLAELGDGQAITLAAIVCLALAVVATGTLMIVRSPEIVAHDAAALLERLAPAPDSLLRPLGPAYLGLLPLAAAGVRVAVVWWPGSALWSQARETLTGLAATAALVLALLVLAVVPDPTRAPTAWAQQQLRQVAPAIRIALAPLQGLERLFAPPSGPQPTSAERDAPADPAFKPYWVRNHRLTGLWSGPVSDDDVQSFGATSRQFCVFRVVLPQQGDRLYVLNPLTDNYLWIDAEAVGPVGEPRVRSDPRPSWDNCEEDLYTR
jgi:hypothetical protein